MAPKPKAKKRPSARKRAVTKVQVDRQKSSPHSGVGEPNGTQEKTTGYEPVRDPLEHANFDHHAAEEERQAELQAERDEHNRRTAGLAA